eukprot:snap_masked-scaffold_2-processed-gene-27.45-mRNA-1 protein AED:1.00 eAED:1.00 QI:0/-1/0/0/-1/1/1/0/250
METANEIKHDIDNETSSNSSSIFQNILEKPYLIYEIKKPTVINRRIANSVPDMPHCCYLHKIGNMFVLKVFSHKKINLTEDKSIEIPDSMCMLGPCWPMVIFVTVAMIFVALGTIGVVGVSMEDPFQDTTFLIFASIGIMLLLGSLISYFLTACSNPGIVPLVHRRKSDSIHAEMTNKRMFWDDRVGIYKSRHQFYDREIGLVVEEPDHFCPWTGTMIAKRNLKRFRVFITFCNSGCLFFVMGGFFLIGS